MCEANTKKYVADYVSDDYKEWCNERIKFDAGTGKGKTYFCLQVLGTYAKEKDRNILYLCNRVPLREEKGEIVERLLLDGVITVKTYQAIETILEHGDKIDYYDYVIVDEAHYFIEDSQFNEKTTISYNWIMSLDDCVVIFASATAKRFFATFEGRIYIIPNSYEYVDRIEAFTKSQMIPILKTMLKYEPESKAIVFVNSANRMLELHEVFREQTFYCSRSTKNRQLKKICVSELPIVDGKLVSSAILFTTKVLDNGVDVKDENVKYIISELADMDSLIQSLGRWRKPNDDARVTFFVRNYRKGELTGFLNIVNGKYKMIEEFRNDPERFRNKYRNNPKFIRKYPQFNQYSGCEIEIDEASAMKIEDSIHMYQRAISTSWIHLLLEKLNADETIASRVCYSKIESEIKKKNKELLKEYLQTLEDKKIYIDSPEMRKTKEMIEHYGELSVKAKGLKHPIKIWNALLDTFYEDKYRYRFSTKGVRDTKRKLPDGKDNPYFKKTYHVFERGLAC